MEQLICTCSCNSLEHMMVFIKDTETNEVWCEVHLAPLPWYKRLRRALSYIFGYRCAYGDFEEIILKDSDKIKIVEYLDPDLKEVVKSANIKLRNLVVFLAANGIVSQGKIAQIIELSKSDFNYLYCDKIAQEIEKQIKENK